MQTRFLRFSSDGVFDNHTTTAKGLRVTCRLDRRKYLTGRKVTAEEMKQVNIYPETFHGEWNYMIKLHNTDGLRPNLIC